MKKKILVCPNWECRSPLISTFAFAGAEKYCLNCGFMGDIFSGDRVEATSKLLAKRATIRRKWGQVRRHLIGGGA